MSRAPGRDPDNQLDLFLPYIADLNFRDQREVMERPFFSLAKSKRVKPIDYTSPDGKLWVHVSANPDYGMATIWDGDILIYCASVLADMARRGVNDVPRKLNIMPFDLLRSIGRPTTGRAYELLAQSLDRLVSTTIKTNIRAENRREATFSWLDGWTQLVDERTERSKGMTIELSNWFYEGVLMKGGVLAIDRAYFQISGGRERWLYKVARKHAGGAGEQGFAIAMPTLFEKSGAEGEYRRFKFELIKLVQKNALPGYALALEPSKGGGEPLLRMTRREDGGAGQGGEAAADGAASRRAVGKHIAGAEGTAKAADRKVSSRKLSASGAGDAEALRDNRARSNAGTKGQGGALARPAMPHSETKAEPLDSITAAALTAPAPRAEEDAPLMDVSSLIRRSVRHLGDASTRGFIADETAILLRDECPGWDLNILHAEFEAWVSASAERTPANWQKAFIGWVRRYHDRNRHVLRG